MKHANGNALEIVGAESLGVRSLCCAVNREGRRIIVDPGIALGYFRRGQYPHPVQVAVGKRVRRRILKLLERATDVVFSHFHGDHVPLKHANPFQLSLLRLPRRVHGLHAWSKGADEETGEMRQRFCDLQEFFGNKLTVPEARSVGPLAFSPALPHGQLGSKLGKVMMTRIDMGGRVFVHASDIQLLNSEAVEKILQWQPDFESPNGW
jgi:predicted metallo-beta-lactamase superfamily hydrolase